MDLALVEDNSNALNHLATVTGTAAETYEAPEEAGAAGRKRRTLLGAVSYRKESA